MHSFLLSMISIKLSSVILSQGKDILPFSFWQQRNLDKSASSLKFLFEQSKTLDGQVHGSCTIHVCMMTHMPVIIMTSHLSSFPYILFIKAPLHPIGLEISQCTRKNPFLRKLCLKGHLRHLEDDMDWEKFTLVFKYQGCNLVHLCSFLHQLMVH